MPEISVPAKLSDAVALEKIYIEIRAAIRETDNISSKLLNLVPLVSGTALTGLVYRIVTGVILVATVVSLFAQSRVPLVCRYAVSQGHRRAEPSIA